MKESIKEIRTATVTDKGQICIPSVARDAIGLKEGTKVSIIVYPDRVELRPLDFVTDRLSTAYASEKSLAKHWNSKGDDKAWKGL